MKSPLRRLLLLVPVLGLVVSPPPAGAELIAFYSFDDPGSPWRDDSGKGADLESAGVDPEYVAEGGFGGSGAYLFHGSQRWLIPLDLFWEEPYLPKVTMGAWVRTSNLSPGLRKVIGSDNGGYDRVLGLDTRPSFGYSTFLGTGVLPGGPAPVSTEQWTFLAVSYDQDAGEAVLYVGLDASTLAPLTVLTAPTGFGDSCASPVSLGSVGPNTGGEGWQGAIDNVFFYDEILTPEQVFAICRGGKTTILGTGGGDPALLVSGLPDLQGLGNFPDGHTFSFTIRNTGTVNTLTISGVTLAGVDSSYYSIVRFPESLAPGAEDTIEFKLSPAGQVGTFSASATVASNDPENASVALDLSAKVLGNSLLALYGFDNADDPLADDSGNGRTLTTVPEQPETVPFYEPAGGIAGGAYIFDGFQRLIAPVNIRADAVPYLTMGAWVKPANLEPGYFKFIGIDAGWSRVIGLDPRGDAGFRYTGFTGSGVFADPLVTPENTDDWNFIAVSYEQPAGRMTMYGDLNAGAPAPGNLVSAAGSASFGNGTTTTSIGSLSPGTANEGWQGYIDNVFFVSGKLDAAGIQAVRDGGKDALLALRPDPVLDVPDTRPFGITPLPGSRSVTLTLRNTGATRPLQIVSAAITGPDADKFSLGPVPASIDPGASVEVQVDFNPGTAGGVFYASLDVVSNDQIDRADTVDLTALATFPNLKDALLAFYPFEGAQPLADASGNERLLQLVEGNEPEFVDAGGFDGGAYRFYGAQQLIAPLNIGPDAHPRLSMGAWVRTDAIDPGYYKIIGADIAWSRVIGLDPRGDAGFRYTGFTGNGVLDEPTPAPEDPEAWTFIAVTYDQFAGTMSLYVDPDGRSARSNLVTATGAASFQPNQPVTSIGSLRPDHVGEGWIGDIDNVFFYRTVLTPEQVLAIRNGGAAAILADNPDIPPVEDSPFAITSAVLQSPGVVRLTWESEPGASYQVERTADPATGPWTAAGAPVTATGPSTSTDVTAPQGATRIFLRVRKP